MNQSCFICNAEDAFTRKGQSLKWLGNVLEELLEKTLPDDLLESKAICQICQDTCLEYKNIKQRLATIKEDLITKFKKTLPNHIFSYDSLQSFNTGNSSTTASANTHKTPLKRVVLPASKLQPLPADYVLNKLPNITNLTPYKPPIIKLSTGPTAITPNIATQTLSKDLNDHVTLTKIVSSDASSVASTKNIFNVANTNPIDNSNTADNKNMNYIQLSPMKSSNSQTTSSVRTLSSTRSMDMKVLPTDLVVETDVMKKEKCEEYSIDIDEEAMEIDDTNFSVRVVKEDSNNGADSLKQDDNDKAECDDKNEYIQELVFGELEVLSDSGQDGDDSHESIMLTESGNSGGKMRVVRGRKLVYSAEELGLVDDEGADENNESADESQIELQLSGDEETANAIIQAAQEQGGAFIKVESGEMFRVKSVQSAEIKNEIKDCRNIVEKVGDKYKCLVCEVKSGESALYAADNAMHHARGAHAARVYICSRCGLVLYKRQQYNKHIVEHAKTSRPAPKSTLNAAPHRCEICGKTFASKYTHLAHLKTHQDRPRPYKCEQCSKSFLTPQNLTQHVKTHSGVKDFICKDCGKAFGSQHNLEMHSVVHSGQKPFSCSTCGKRFARRAELVDHNRTHTGERPFGCPECGARFAQRSNLHSHRRAAHLHDHRHACHLCPKRFKRRRLLDYHIKACHTGERPLRCEICNATFVYPEHYKKHLRIHSGERPFTCEVCGKSFNSRDIRNTHRFVHSDKKPYECLVCGAGFMRRPLLYAHMNNAGHLAESIVVNQPRVQKVTKTSYEPQEVQLVSVTSENSSDGAAVSVGDGPKLYITSDKKLVFEDVKSSINLTEDTELEQTEGSTKTDMSALLQSISADQLVDGAQVIYTEGDEIPADADDANFVRMVPIRLDDGNTGWLAITN